MLKKCLETQKVLKMHDHSEEQIIDTPTLTREGNTQGIRATVDRSATKLENLWLRLDVVGATRNTTQYDC